MPAYKQANLPVEERIKDLVGRMTVEEKARQLDMYFGCRDLMGKDQLRDHIHAKADAKFDRLRAEKVLGNLGAGAIHDLYPTPELYNAMQKWVIESNRLGVPALFTAEGLHGYMGFDQTVFPQSINLATTWNPELARKTGAAIAAEARANGIGMLLSPVLDIARDPRWGRVEENFGEDSYLTGRLGLAYVEGMQGNSLASDHTTVATPKHFAGHGSPESGLNTSPVHIGEREMRSVMLKAFEPAIREGKAMGVMVAYHDNDGVPCAADSWLLTQVLRKEWGFEGIVVADLGAIKRLYDTHHVADSPRDAVCQSINAGVDMQFYDFDYDTFQGAIVEGVRDGQLPLAVLDQAVSRVLRVKFRLGLFDDPYVDPAINERIGHCAANRELALEVARQSMCLLKNEGSLLPLKKDIACIAVIGPNSNITRFGDYAAAATENAADGMLEQIKKTASPRTRVLHAAGDKVEEAVSAARQSDVVILGLGEWTGISGEWSDRSKLGLPGKQQELLEAVAATGKPIVLVLQNGRPLTISWAAKHVPAILEAWYPGESGGQAIAETLFGDNNPAGRLPVTFPRRIGQLPVFYNHFPSKGTKYVDGTDSPQFVFGHGLSYTTFEYKNLTVTPPQKGSNGDVLVTFDLTNSGKRGGDEVAQLYMRKTTASVATPTQALKGFTRVHLEPGETQRISFAVPQSELAIWGASRAWRVEQGEYTLVVGGSSNGGMSKKFVLEPRKSAHAEESNTSPRFERIQLSPEFLCEGANFADFNHDGAQDIVAGPYWYAGPDFAERSRYRPGKALEVNDYSDQFFSFTYDVDGDSWSDVIVIGMPGTEAFLFRNPQGQPGDWERHVAFPVVDNESPTLVDVTGDGRPELVFNTDGRLGYAELDSTNPKAVWKFHAITDDRGYEKYTHGLGVGDVNGDGRQDLIEKTGWWEQPESLAAESMWRYHPAKFSENGGAQMHAYDFDGDGDNDVVTSKNAHGYGLAWFENLDGAGNEFKEHLILEETAEPGDGKISFSQLHAVAIADIDGDGVKDIVTGKRFWAHNGRDPGERDPAVLYWFRTVRKTGGVDFVPYLIDANSGVGTQIIVGDLNGDGRPDTLVGNKKGLFVMRQVPKSSDPNE